jgi:hypothetical protein
VGPYALIDSLRQAKKKLRSEKDDELVVYFWNQTPYSYLFLRAIHTTRQTVDKVSMDGLYRIWYGEDEDADHDRILANTASSGPTLATGKRKTYLACYTPRPLEQRPYACVNNKPRIIIPSLIKKQPRN